MQDNTKAYQDLKDALFAYAESRGELESRRADLTKLYKNIEGADIDAELTADLVGDYLFTDKGFIKNLTSNKSLFRKIYDEIKYLYKKATGKQLTEIEKVKREFDKAWKEMSIKEAEQKNTAESGVRYSLVGRTIDGVGIYKTNYPENTPKSIKQNDLISLVQNIWSNKPISLDIVEDGTAKKIVAKFNPELSERSDLSKIAFGNRKGNGSEKRMTLDLAADLYQIAADSKYLYSKEAEPKPDNHAHDGVVRYHYFITNLIYQDNDNNYTPCYMNIDVKQNANGNWFYSFAIEKGSAPQTLLAAVTGEKPATLPNNNIPQNSKKSSGEWQFPLAAEYENTENSVRSAQDDIAPVKKSLSNIGEQPSTVGTPLNDLYYGKDVALTEDIAPMPETISKMETVEDLEDIAPMPTDAPFPDEIAPKTEETMNTALEESTRTDAEATNRHTTRSQLHSGIIDNTKILQTRKVSI